MYTLMLIAVFLMLGLGIYSIRTGLKYEKLKNDESIPIKERKHYAEIEDRCDFFAAFGIIPGIILTIVCVIVFGVSASVYVDNKIKYKNQSLVVEIQKQRIARLKASLDRTYKVAKKRDLLFNNDSPIKTLIDQLAEAEKALAEAKTAKIEAKNHIESTANGQMWLVALIYGKPRG